MRIPPKGFPKDKILSDLKTYKESDTDWQGGKMFGHAFLAGADARELVERAYLEYLWENSLDPSLFPSVLRLENEVVSMAAVHLGGDEKVVGNFTSGGTESIFLAVKAARDRFLSAHPDNRPEMIVPVTAHAAFHKAAHYMGLKLVPVPVDMATFKASVESIKYKINDNSALVVASAPSYAHGVIDPISEIGRIALANDIPFHVDACMGGFLLPYWKKLGAKIEEFDFSVPGVTSISMDFHKYAFAAKGASVILFKNKGLRKHSIFTCSSWTGYTIINPTVQSSRSAGPLAGTWAVLNYIGHDGYLEITRKLKEATERVIAAIESIPELYVMGKPEFCIFGVASDGPDIFHLVDEMKARGWHIQAQMGLGGHKENFHLTMLPVNLAMIDEWMRDLRDSVKAAAHLEKSEMAAKLASMFSGEDAVELTDDEIRGFFQALGVSTDSMPSKMAEINQILNALPPKVADAALTAFVNDLYKRE